MKYDPDIHHRRSVRLRGYDYSAIGAYFVTICAHGRECLFGEIRSGEMVLSDVGNAVREWWQKLPERFPNAALDEYMIMPNHFHGIIVISDVGATTWGHECRATTWGRPYVGRYGGVGERLMKNVPVAHVAGMPGFTR